MPRYYLGVDGGGTNCRVRLADENLETLAEVKNGRSNLQIDGGDPAYKAILDGTRDVFKAAGIDYAETANTYACFGMAGGRMDTARAEFAARDWPFAGVKVYDDIDIAHAGALGGGEGGVVIIGTGSAAMSIVGGTRYQADSHKLYKSFGGPFSVHVINIFLKTCVSAGLFPAPLF